MGVLLFTLKFFHYLACVMLIVVVVLQAGKSGVIGGRGGIFGGGGAGQIFDAPSGAAFVNKLTIFMSCVFLLTSLLLAKFYVSISMVSVIV
ncbi:MAG: preprotein translocase subunit SecG [Endomicrobium sp.]|jgi:protein translocase SecG subunit|nr:preprotein translocase subunit SecG [Endomicrobium sp.]